MKNALLRPTIQDYRDALSALIPLAADRADELSDFANEEDEDAHRAAEADEAWTAVETARALMAGK